MFIILNLTSYVRLAPVSHDDDGGSGIFYFLLDEEQLAQYHLQISGASYPNGAATINLELTAGQIVRIENWGSSTIYGTNSNGLINSWFTGHLLYAL